MVVFDSSIFTEGANRAERRGARTQNTLQQLGQSLMKQEQLENARLDKQRLEAAKLESKEKKSALSEQALFTKANASGVESFTPEESAAWQFHEAKRGSKQITTPEGYRVSENLPLMESGQAPVQPSIPQPTQEMQGAPVASDPTQGLVSTLSPKGRLEFQKKQIEEAFNARKRATDIKEEEPKAARQVETLFGETQDTNKLIRGIFDTADAWNTGMGSMLSFLPNSSAKDLESDLETIRADATFSELKALKASGATLGAISEAELSLLGAAKTNLDASQSTEQLKRNLKKYYTIKNRMLGSFAGAYKDKYGSLPSGYVQPKTWEQLGEKPKGGLTGAKKTRLEELRAKRAKGEI